MKESDDRDVLTLDFIRSIASKSMLYQTYPLDGLSDEMIYQAAQRCIAFSGDSNDSDAWAYINLNLYLAWRKNKDRDDHSLIQRQRSEIETLHTLYSAALDEVERLEGDWTRLREFIGSLETENEK